MTPAQSIIVAAVAVTLVAPALAQEHSHDDSTTPPKLRWSFAGPFGKFDRGQLQRGYFVYREVCQTCHGMQLLSFRNLSEAGGPGFSEAQVAAVAAEYKVQDGTDDQGKPIERNAR